MLMIRLARRGKKNKPFYRIIVSEKSKDTFGDYLDAVGYYYPVAAKKEISIDGERVKFWMERGAQPSPTVKNLLIDQKVITGTKVITRRAKKKEEK